MHFLIEIVLVTIAIALAGGVLWTSSYTLRNDGVTLHYLLALVAWVPVWFFTHVVWYWIQSWMAPSHHTAIGYPWWFWLILAFGVLVAFVPRSAPVVWLVGLALVVVALCYVNWFKAQGVHHQVYFMVTLVLLALTAVALIVWAITRIGALAMLAATLASATALAAVAWSLAVVQDHDGGKSHEAKNPHAPSTTTVTNTSITTAITTATASPPPANSTKIVDQICKIVVACKQQGAVNYGSQVDFKKHTATHGVNDFTAEGQVLKSQHDVSVFLNGSSAQSKAAKAEVEAAIKKAGFGQSEINRALNGTGYFAVQPTQASQMLGTTYFQNGKVLTVDGWRAINPGDVFWFFMTQDGTIVKGAILRADCGNSHLIKVRLVTPQTPVVPPATCAVNCHPPVCVYLHKPSTPVPPNGLCPKDPSEDPQGNGNVPTQVVKHHPDPDNGSEISRGPVKPTDSGNGIPKGATSGASAPRSTPASAPSGHKGSGPTLPPPTESPAPPSNTSVAPTPIPEPPCC